MKTRDAIERARQLDACQPALDWACGQAAGISYWTLYRAGLALGVKKVRVTEGFSGQGRWLWSLGGAA